jgi:hypothetical protein
MQQLSLAGMVGLTLLPGIGRYAGFPVAGHLRDRRFGAYRRGPRGELRHPAARSPLRTGSHRRPGVHARQPAAAVRGDLRAPRGGGRRRSDVDHRRVDGQRAAGPRSGPRRRRRRGSQPDHGVPHRLAEGHRDAPARCRLHHRGDRRRPRLGKPCPPGRAAHLHDRRGGAAGPLPRLGPAVHASRRGCHGGRGRSWTDEKSYIFRGSGGDARGARRGCGLLLTMVRRRHASGDRSASHLGRVCRHHHRGDRRQCG